MQDLSYDVFVVLNVTESKKIQNKKKTLNKSNQDKDLNTNSDQIKRKKTIRKTNHHPQIGTS
jgi:hypothetical protein